MKSLLVGLTILCIGLSGPAQAYDYRTLHLSRDRHTHIAILATLPPEGGDPPQRGTAECARMEPLDRRARNLAQTFGRMFQQSGIHFDSVLTGRVCRQIAVARALAIGPVTEQPLLDPLTADEADTLRRTEALLSLIEGQRPGETLLLITDRSNIEALTGERPELGEGIVFTLRPFGEIKVRGRFSLPPR